MRSNLYRTRAWRRLADAVKDRAGRRCEACGKCAPLEAHHSNPHAGFYDAAHLVALCRSCHNLAHGRTGYRGKRGRRPKNAAEVAWGAFARELVNQ